ncbi:MAG: acyl carrier protein [Planctomycetota bacterium]
MSGVDREPLRAHFTALIGGDRSLLPKDEESLVDEGILDSFGLAELTALLARVYGVKVPDADVALTRFESVAKIAGYVESKRA